MSTACHGSVHVVRFIIERWLDYDSSGFDHAIPAGLVKWAAIGGDSDWGFHMSNRGRGVRLQVEGYKRSRPHQMEARRAPWGWSRGRVARQHRGPGFAWIYRRQILIYWVVTGRVSCLWLYSLESTKYHSFIQVITVKIFFSSYKELVITFPCKCVILSLLIHNLDFTWSLDSPLWFQEGSVIKRREKKHIIKAVTGLAYFIIIWICMYNFPFI